MGEIDELRAELRMLRDRQEIVDVVDRTRGGWIATTSRSTRRPTIRTRSIITESSSVGVTSSSPGPGAACLRVGRPHSLHHEYPR